MKSTLSLALALCVTCVLRLSTGASKRHLFGSEQSQVTETEDNQDTIDEWQQTLNTLRRLQYDISQESLKHRTIQVVITDSQVFNDTVLDWSGFSLVKHLAIVDFRVHSAVVFTPNVMPPNLASIEIVNGNEPKSMKQHWKTYAWPQSMVAMDFISVTDLTQYNQASNFIHDLCSVIDTQQLRNLRRIAAHQSGLRGVLKLDCDLGALTNIDLHASQISRIDIDWNYVFENTQLESVNIAEALFQMHETKDVMPNKQQCVDLERFEPLRGAPGRKVAELKYTCPCDNPRHNLVMWASNSERR